MTRKVWIFVAVLALAAIVPEVVYAATGTFTSTSSVTALTASNSDGGRALSATANSGYAGVLTRTATSGTVPTLQGTSYSRTGGAAAIYGYEVGSTGKTYGVWGRAASSTDGTAGVTGLATAGTGKTNGVSGQTNSVLGSGVLGYAPSGAGVQGVGGIFGILGFGGPFAVAGIGGAIGDGTYGVISTTDTGVGGHLVGAGADLAGTCTVAASATVSPDCLFTNPFPDTNVLVVVSPTSNPGAFYWTAPASTGAADGFVVHLASAPGSAVTFNYIVAGLDSTIAASMSAKAARVAGVPR